jgi:hypothetical protein
MGEPDDRRLPSGRYEFMFSFGGGSSDRFVKSAA